MANIIESRVTLEDEVFEEAIDTMEEPIEVIRPSSYNDLEDLPQVNGVTLMGNKTSEELGIVTATDIENTVSAEATLRENADTTLGGRIDGEITNRTNADNALGTRIDNEILARQGGDNNLQTQIDAITSKSDVVDVVADYASLQAYDTQHLGNNDVIKVLDDETHDDAQTYYRWNKTAGTWSYIGSEAPYYSKGQMDTMLQAKQDKLIAGTNIQIGQDGKTISATDTTYTAGNGLNLNGTEFSADTTVLATKSDLDSYYTKTETDTKLAPKLEAEVVAELPSTGTEGKLYLTPKNYTTGTATGNPITISLGEDAGQITSAQLDGDTYQQKYSGKNLCGGTLAQLKNRNISGTWNGNQYTQSGITWTVYENADGTIDRIEASGQATESGKTFYIRSFDRQQFEEQIGSEDIYTLSGCPQGGSSGYYVRVASIPWKAMLTDRGSAATGTLVPADNYNSVHVILGIDTGAGQVNNLVFRPQLELGSTATSYEPFVGGQPSPSPSYPQPVQTVTGEQTVTVVGKNIFNKTNLSNLYNGTTTVATNQSAKSVIVKCLPNTTYTYTNPDGALIKSDSSIGFYASEPVVGLAKSGTNVNIKNNTSMTFTTPATAEYMLLYFAWGNDGSEDGIQNAQIELGSTASSYAPFSKQTLPLNLGKNLLSMTDETTTSGSAVSTVSSNNHFEISGTVSESWGFQLVASRKQIAPIQPGTYTLSITNPLPFATRVQFRNTSSGASLVGNLDIPSGTTSITFTLNETANYITWWSTASVGTTVTASFDAMIEAGSQATTYAPYKTPIELCKLGTYQDYIYKDGDDWKVHKVTNKIILDGTETWSNDSGTIGTNYRHNFAFSSNPTIPRPKNVSDSVAEPSLSTHFMNIPGSGRDAQIFGSFYMSYAWAVFTDKNGVYNKSTFLTWLGTTKPACYYVLNSATDTVITDQTLIAQLEAIRTASLQASNTITNTATGSNLAGDMELGYYEYDPNNRYDKWLWLDLNNNYEKLGS